MLIADWIRYVKMEGSSSSKTEKSSLMSFFPFSNSFLVLNKT